MSIKKSIREYPIWSFLILNYLISWTFLYPSYQSILKNDQITPFALIGFIGAYGPSIAAIIVQYIIDKKKVRALFRSIIKVRTAFRTIVFIIVAPIAFYILAYLISALLYDGNLNANLLAGLSGIAFWFLAALPFGPMGEELGWRGFMLPKLLEDHSIIKSTIFVGLAWGVWHLASFTFPGAAIPGFLDVSIWSILLFIANTIALSFVYTYVFFRTKGSVFYAILLHAFFNAASNITFDFFGETTRFYLQLSAYCINFILAAICGLILLKKHQTKLKAKEID